MAFNTLALDLVQDLICPVCKELFRDPVTLDCGHNFCRGCIRTVRDTECEPSCCPGCGDKIADRQFISNGTLAVMAERAKGMDPIAGVAGKLRPTLPGTCSVAGCEEKSVQLCPDHCRSLCPVLGPDFLCKGHGERPTVAHTGGSDSDRCSVSQCPISIVEPPVSLSKEHGKGVEVAGSGSSMIGMGNGKSNSERCSVSPYLLASMDPHHINLENTLKVSTSQNSLESEISEDKIDSGWSSVSRWSLASIEVPLNLRKENKWRPKVHGAGDHRIGGRLNSPGLSSVSPPLWMLPRTRSAPV